MNRKTAIAFIVTLLISGVVSGQTVDNPAPDFSGIDSSGNTFQLSDFKGRVVVLEWTNHDCPYVRKHYGTGNMQALQNTADQRGVVWVSIISSAPGKQGYVDGEEADRLTDERGAAPDYVILDSSGDIGRLYRATNTPHMFVINEEGVLVYIGAIDDQPSSRWESVESAQNYVELALNDVFAGRPVAIPVTRAYGCSVKY